MLPNGYQPAGKRDRVSESKGVEQDLHQNQEVTMALGRDKRPLVSRRVAAARLGVTYAQVRTLQDSGALRPVRRGSDGAYRFDQCDLDALADTVRARSSRPRGDAGAVAAKVFALLEEGKTIRQLVMETEQPPAVIRELVRSWVDAGDAVILEAPLARKCEELVAGVVELDWQKLDEALRELCGYRAELLRGQLAG
jgi:DNA-binding transcriptional MerR regulator